MITPGAPIADVAALISSNVEECCRNRGAAFAKEITDRFVADFEKPGDKMAHVSTFVVIDGMVYMTYYANTKEPSEDPKNQTARLAYAPVDDLSKMVYLDLQTTGDTVGGKVIDMVYDTILMQKDDTTIYILWTARTEENYYRFYCPFTLSTKTLGEIGVNRFQVGDITNDFSATGIRGGQVDGGIEAGDAQLQVTKLAHGGGDGMLMEGTAPSGHLGEFIKIVDLDAGEFHVQRGRNQFFPAHVTPAAGRKGEFHTFSSS
jgi:hypothetical protein